MVLSDPPCGELTTTLTTLPTPERKSPCGLFNAGPRRPTDLTPHAPCNRHSPPRQQGPRQLPANSRYRRPSTLGPIQIHAMAPRGPGPAFRCACPGMPGRQPAGCSRRCGCMHVHMYVRGAGVQVGRWRRCHVVKLAVRSAVPYITFGRPLSTRPTGTTFRQACTSLRTGSESRSNTE